MNKREAQFAAQMLRSSKIFENIYLFYYVTNKRGLYKEPYIVLVQSKDYTDQSFTELVTYNDVMTFIEEEIPKIRMNEALS